MPPTQDKLKENRTVLPQVKNIVAIAISEIATIGIDVQYQKSFSPAILPKVFSLDLPLALEKSVIACKGDRLAIRQVGIEWAIQQSKELIAFGVPTVHYYSMGKSDNIVKIAKEVF